MEKKALNQLKMKNLLEYIPFLIIAKIVQLLGIKRLNFPTKMLSGFFYNLLKIRRDVVFKNLAIAFPEKSEREREKIAQNSYYHFSRLILEIMCVPKMRKDEVVSLVKCNEVEELTKVYNRNNGLIILTAHFGNWEVGAMSVPAQMGTIMYPIIKPQRNPYITEWLKIMRESHGNKVIPLGPSIRNVYEVIKKGNLLGVVGDQRGPKEGRRVKLFGRETAIYSGTAEIVSKTLTPLYVLFAAKVSDHYQAFVERIELNDLPEDREMRINIINQKFADLLEKYVRLYPEQWFWMHNIWKY